MIRAGLAFALVASGALAGCATVAPADPNSDATRGAITTAPEPEPSRAAPLVTVPKPPPEPVARPTPPPDTWTRIREAYAFAGCERPRVVAAQRRFLRAPHALARQIERAMPLLVLVFEALDARGLPGEYVFLPLIESGYAPIDAGHGPSGIWQLMPVTARGLGLVIDASYDGRLDTLASTEAAVALLSGLGRRFDADWRLVTMAYNAGEFRVRRALRGRATKAPPLEHERLALPAITHAHLAKLEALACIAKDPARHGVALHELPPEDRLASVVVDAPLDLDLAAALAGLPEEEFRRLNRAHRGVARAGRRLVVSADAIPRYERVLARIPPAARASWRRVARDVATAHATDARGIDADLLAEINHDATREAWVIPGTASRAAAGDTAATRHTVRPGESLWLIARRYRTSVAALLEANALDARALLRPGDVLRIARPGGSAAQ